MMLIKQSGSKNKLLIKDVEREFVSYTVKKVFCVLFCFFTIGCVLEPEWARTVGGPYQDVALTVAATSDGYILSGYTKSMGAGGEDVWLVKTDRAGQQLWQQSFGGTGDDRAVSVKVTADGSYILAGCTYSFSGNAQKSDAYLIKTSDNGAEIWTKTYGEPDSFEEIFSVQETPDGGYILAGTKANSTVDIYLIRTDLAGEILWSKTIDFSGQSWANDIICTIDGGYLLTGIVKSKGPGIPVGEIAGDVFLLKIDSIGDELWLKKYEGSLEDEGYRVAQTPDGGYIVAGTTYSFGAGKSDIYLVKTNVDGEMTWAHTFGGAGSDVGRCVVPIGNDGFLVGGTTESSTSFDMFVARTDSNGKEVWTKTFGNDKGFDICNDIAALANSEFVLAGVTDSFGENNGDMLLVKFDSDGRLLWNDNKVLFNEWSSIVSDWLGNNYNRRTSLCYPRLL